MRKVVWCTAGLLIATMAVIAVPAKPAAAGSSNCDGFANVVTLAEGESYNGTSKADVIYGYGNNTINGNGGNDSICVEGENNVVHGNSGNDSLYTLNEGTGDLDGDSGNDVLDGQFIGIAHGGSGNDNITFFEADEVYGDAGNDYIAGDYAGFVSGGSNNDFISVFEAGEVFGNAGSDIIHVFSASSIDCGSGRDRYSDFDQSAQIANCEMYDLV